MLDVDNIYGNSSSYINSYWKNNLIIEHSKLKINIEDNKQKMNEILKKDKHINEQNNYNSGYSSINSNYSRKQYIDIGMNNNQDTYEYRKFQKYSEPKNKKEMNNLSEKCRIYEYNQRERKILGIWSKPKLLNK